MNAQVKPVRVLDNLVIEQFNDTNVQLLSKELEKQLAELGSRFGVSLSVRPGKSTSNTLSLSVKAFIGGGTAGKPEWKANYMRLCHLIGLTEQDFGRRVHNTNLKHPEKLSYEIVGMTPKTLDLIIRTDSDHYYRLPINESKFADVDAIAVETVIEPVEEGVLVETTVTVEEAPVRQRKAIDIEPELEELSLDDIDDLGDFDHGIDE